MSTRTAIGYAPRAITSRLRRLTMRAAAISLLILVAFAVPSRAAFPPPSNDACASPIVVTTLPFSDDLDLGTATIEGNDPHSNCACASTGQDQGSVWYRFTPAANVTISV